VAFVGAEKVSEIYSTLHYIRPTYNIRLIHMIKLTQQQCNIDYCSNNCIGLYLGGKLSSEQRCGHFIVRVLEGG